MSKKRLLWLVDVQKDFMNSSGGLYVPGAEGIKENIWNIQKWASENGIRQMGSMDAHSLSDPELNVNGGPFPLHCMVGSEGQGLLPDGRPSKNAVIVQNRQYDGNAIYAMKRHPGDIYFEKQHYDIATNGNVADFMGWFGPYDEVIIIGVATDYCVKAAVEFFSKFMKYPVTVVRDAIKGIDERQSEQLMLQWYHDGITITTTKDLIS